MLLYLYVLQLCKKTDWFLKTLFLFLFRRQPSQILRTLRLRHSRYPMHQPRPLRRVLRCFHVPQGEGWRCLLERENRFPECRQSGRFRTPLSCWRRSGWCSWKKTGDRLRKVFVGSSTRWKIQIFYFALLNTWINLLPLQTRCTMDVSSCNNKESQINLTLWFSFFGPRYNQRYQSARELQWV